MLLLQILESFCCWLKNNIPPIEDYYLEGASVAGVVHRKHYRSPPVGMRSAVPLGGLAAGSFEMRADGELFANDTGLYLKTNFRIVNCIETA